MNSDASLKDNENVVIQAVMYKNARSAFLICALVFTVMPIFFAVMTLTAGDQWYKVFAILPFLAIGIGSLIALIRSFKVAKNIALILTSQRIFIYDKRQKGYLNFELNEVQSWQHDNHWVRINGKPQNNSKFTFITNKGTFIAKGIENYYPIYDAFFNVLAFQCTNPIVHRSLEHSSGINRNVKVVIDKLGFDKYETVQCIKKYTDEDLNVINTKLTLIPCLVSEDMDKSFADLFIMELNALGNNAYKVN